MKNNNFKNKAQKQPKKKKNSLSFYIVLGLMIFCLVGSILGSVAFARSFADVDAPIVTNYQPVQLENGVDLTNKWVAVRKTDVDNESNLFDIYELYFVYTGSVDYSVDGVLSNQVPFDLQDKGDFYLFYLDFDLYNNVYNDWVESGDIRDPLTDMVVSNVSSDIDIYYYVPFNNGVGVLGSITSTLTGGIVGIGQGVGSGLSTLTSSVFINDGSLSTFGIFVVVFSAIALAIGLCRLVVAWLVSLGGKKV